MVSPKSTSALWIGPACGIASAVLYTLTNIALRNCVDVDAYLVSAVKAAPTVVMLGPLIGWMSLRKSSTQGVARSVKTASTSRGLMLQFVAASFLAQFFGNAAFQKALQHIGLAASVPITLGVLIVGGAIFGAVILKEPVGTRKVIAMITLIVAVVVLSLPHPTGEPSPRPDEPDAADSMIVESGQVQTKADHVGASEALDVVVGSLWAALSGLAYSFFGVTMRQTLQSGLRSSTLMFISGVTGSVTLWMFCFATLGSSAIASTSVSQWATMIAAGLLNFSAFIAITTSLRLLPVVAVNLINASQVAMAAVAGVLLFGEPVTTQLGIGILLTLVGLVILARRTRAPIVITD